MHDFSVQDFTDWRTLGRFAHQLPTGEVIVRVNGGRRLYFTQFAIGSLIFSLFMMKLMPPPSAAISLLSVLGLLSFLVAILALVMLTRQVSFYVLDPNQKAIFYQQSGIGDSSQTMLMPPNSMEAVVMNTSISDGINTSYRYGLVLIGSDGQRVMVQPPLVESYADTVTDGERLAKLFGVDFIKGEEKEYAHISFENLKLSVTYSDASESRLTHKRQWPRNGWVVLGKEVYQGLDNRITLMAHPYAGSVFMGLAVSTLIVIALEVSSYLLGMSFGLPGKFDLSVAMVFLFLSVVLVALYYQYGVEYVVWRSDRRLTRDYRLFGFKVLSRSFSFDELHTVAETAYRKKDEQKGYQYRYGLSLITNSGAILPVLPVVHEVRSDVLRDGRYLADLLETSLLTTSTFGELRVAKGEKEPKITYVEPPLVPRRFWLILVAIFLALHLMTV